MTIKYKPGVVLLQTKLNRPGVAKELIVRPRLLNTLDAGLAGAMTIVIAPAGFGKTTLVSSWLRTLDDGGDGRALVPSAWLTLDEGDANRDLFLQYFIAALRTIFPDACPETFALLKARQQPAPALVADMLSNELEAFPGRFVLVLDDLHSLRSRTMYDFLAGWMSHWPHLLHLVILSRYSPPLPLAALRAHGQLTEIRSGDLRFSPAETVEYLDRTLEAPPDEATLSLVHERLEGWIAGLKMATLSLSNRREASLALTLRDGDAYIADYLMDEVFSGQPPAMQAFLLQASVADPFCASLCAALLGEQVPDCDPQACIEQLETADLFVSSLDNHHEWYRFHPMFRDLLQRRLSKTMTTDQINELHDRAAGWFAIHGYPDAAIHHALAAGRPELATRVMEQALSEVLNREDRPTLERWLALFPDPYIIQSPELLVMRAWSHGFRWELDRLLRAVEQAEALLDEDDCSTEAKTLRAQIAVLKGQSFYHVNRFEQVVTHCREALTLLPEEWRYARGVAGVYLGVSLQAIGRAAEAKRHLLEQYESARNKTDGYALRLLLALAINAIQSGNYENAERTAQTMLRQAGKGRMSVMEGWGHYLLGFIHYEWNDLEIAARHFDNVVDLFFTTQWVAARNGMIGKAFTSQAQGRGDDALEAIDRLSRIDLEYRGHDEIDTAAARARLMLLRGDMEAAERWGDDYDSPPTESSLLPWMEQPQLARARILIARNRNGDARSALDILAMLETMAERAFNCRIRIEVLALRALALSAQGDSAGAREALTRSVELARRGNFTRIFVDLGPRMERLLHQVAGHGSISRSVARILAAYPTMEAAQVAMTPAANGRVAYSPSPNDDDPDERLTPRELEVLILMSEPISLKIIASRLSISYATARRYTINVYNKLGVHSRWEAVETAFRRGIITAR